MRVKYVICLYIVGIIVILTSILELIRYLLPLNYESIITKYCQMYNLNIPLVYGVINAESHFNKLATSTAGAVGLMQILPSTAKEISGKLNLQSDDWYDESINIHIGCYYLHYLISQFGDINTALCAYNAGPNKVYTWLNDPRYSKDNITLSNIPYKETLNYIRKINIYRTFYTIIYNPQKII